MMSHVLLPEVAAKYLPELSQLTATYRDPALGAGHETWAEMLEQLQQSICAVAQWEGRQATEEATPVEVLPP